LTEDRPFENIFNLVWTDSMAREMLDIVVVPLELRLVHTGKCIDTVYTNQASSDREFRISELPLT